MASKLNPWTAIRRLSVRARSSVSCPEQRIAAPILARRGIADDTTRRPPSDNPESYGSIPPYASQPRQVEYQPKSPEVFAPNFLNAEAIAALEKTAAGGDQWGEEGEGLLFGAPVRPKKHEQLQDRYHPVVTQVTRLLMRNGQLSKAQRNMSMILNYLRTSPAPKINPLRPLLPGAPPPHHLPLNPLLYLTLAIDSVAPLIRVKNMKGMAGGGQALELPEPLAVRARRRQAVMWILDIVNRKQSRGSGRAQFATRFGEEIVAVIEGRSRVWERRQLVHKLGTAARANLMHPNVVGKRR
ncbi:hypothetical protein DL765_008155 [Monosporascus sp. GIB2]|nr:hypothetical protein DL765_008155 [Monosporascus sp. GIB2]